MANKKKKKKKKKILFRVEQNCKYNTSEFAITSTSHTICTTKYTIFTTKYINEKKISRVQNIKLMIINIGIHDHRFDIRHWAQNPQLHVGPFHNFIRFLNAVNTLHCLISLSSVFHKTGDKYDRLFFP